MKNRIRHIEPGAPAQEGQLILTRRLNILRELNGTDASWGRVLDLGCGNGAQTALLKPYAETLVGTDIFPPDSFAGGSGGAAFEFVRADAVHLPFESEWFDLITAFEVLEHVPDDRAACAEIFRALKPGGRFVCSVPNKWWIFESHGATVPGLNFIPWNRVPFVSWLPEGIHDRIARARIYTMRQAVKLMQFAGFEVFGSGYITAPLDILPDRWLRRILRRLIFSRDSTRVPFLAVNLYVAGRKSGEGGA